VTSHHNKHKIKNQKKIKNKKPQKPKKRVYKPNSETKTKKYIYALR